MTQNIIEQQGQSFRLLKSDRPVPILFAVLYWGDQVGDAGITDVFECRIDHDQKKWVNPDMGVEFGFDGSHTITREHRAGARHGVYVSPNQNDCRIYISAFVSGMQFVGKPKEYDESVLHCLVVDHTGNDVESIRLYADRLFRDPDGKWVTARGNVVDVSPNGLTHFRMKDSDRTSIIMFTSHAPEAVRNAASGAGMVLEVLSRPTTTDN